MIEFDSIQSEIDELKPESFNDGNVHQSEEAAEQPHLVDTDKKRGKLKRKRKTQDPKINKTEEETISKSDFNACKNCGQSFNFVVSFLQHSQHCSKPNGVTVEPVESKERFWSEIRNF